MKTRPNEKADHMVNEVTVGSVVSSNAARTMVSFRVAKALGLSLSAFSSGMILDRMTGPRVSFKPKKTIGIVAPLIIN